MEIQPATVQSVWSLASHNQYQNWASYYNETLAALGYSTPERVAALAHAQFVATDRLLELGAGTGLVGEALERLGSPLRLFGADLSLAMLMQMTCQVYQYRQVVDASKPYPYAPDSFDGVLCAGLLEYLVEPGLLFANVVAVLAPGGRLLFSYAPAEHQALEQVEVTSLLLRHHPEVIAAQLAAHGLRVVQEESIAAYWNRGEQIHHRLLVVERPGAKANFEDKAN